MALAPEIKIIEVNTDEFRPVWRKLAEEVFKDNVMFDVWSVLSEQEKQRKDALRKNFGEPFLLSFVAKDADKIVGWARGFQTSVDEFYMMNSAVIPEYRNRGIYSALLDAVIGRALAEGFQEIFSRHAVTNNAVIVPKLKRGFVITSIEASDAHGTCVILRFLKNAVRRKILDARVGLTRADSEVRKHLGDT